MIDTVSHTHYIKVLGYVEYRNDKMIGTPKRTTGALGYAHKTCVDGTSIWEDAPQLF